MKKFNIIRDIQEKANRWNFNGERFNCHNSIIDKHLKTGDYTVEGIEDIFTIEKKSTVNEIFMNFGRGRARFYREIKRLSEYKHPFIIVDATPEMIMCGSPYSKLSPSNVISCLLGIQIKYHIPIIYAGRVGEDLAYDIMRKVWNYSQTGELDAITDR